MLRLGSGILGSNAEIISSSINLQLVRWRRKPRWLPTAKSKLFRVPERKKQDEEERQELLRLHNNYKTQMRSIRSFLHDEVVRQKDTAAGNVLITPEQEEEEFQRAIAINNEWNAKIAEVRNARIMEENRKRQEHILERLELAKTREEDQKEKIEEIVRLEKERAKSFITPDKLDNAIETALANPVDYAFHIDRTANVVKGVSLPKNHIHKVIEIKKSV